MIREEELAQRERTRIGDMYNARGMSNSSQATDALRDLETGLTNSIRLIDEVREAGLEKYKQELMGANTERIKQYDDYITTLTNQSKQFQTDLANQINEYNLASNMSYGDKVSSLLETAKSFQKQMNIDYDEDDKALAEMYASRILDSNGDINTAVL